MNTKIKIINSRSIHLPRPKLTMIKNEGVVVNNKNAPVSCRYCELREDKGLLLGII